MWVPARNFSTSKERKENCTVGHCGKAFGLTELGSFLQRRKMAHDEGFYLFFVAFPFYPGGAKVIKMLKELLNLTMAIE